jgi:hypothetical protein
MGLGFQMTSVMLRRSRKLGGGMILAGRPVKLFWLMRFKWRIRAMSGHWHSLRTFSRQRRW